MFPISKISSLNLTHLTPVQSVEADSNSSSSSSPVYQPISQIPLPSSTKPPSPIAAETHLTSTTTNRDNTLPTMSEIMDSSRAQRINLHLQTLGPFFRITASSLETKRELGRAEGLVRFWLGGKILHLDSIRLRRETLSMEKSIFGIGLFIGAVAIRYGYDCGCRAAELLAINDSDLYHSKLVRFYTRIGFKVVHEVNGSSIEDLAHMLVWGGKGTRMDANIEELMIKWCQQLISKALQLRVPFKLQQCIFCSCPGYSQPSHNIKVKSSE
ncbi:hypothetical protein NE237_031897 [Protea cynaroides]|uniref:Uncharacterized protein n=1 Tax=Protea cynaroides TaxID=273540 RepID=A0A9Q0R311_9MAGN|nr:hypothetical protein NE237_031897 [Protea cynaroides]